MRTNELAMRHPASRGISNTSIPPFSVPPNTLSLAKLTSIKTYTFQTLTQVMADVFEARADISCLRLCRNTTRHDRLTRCVYKFMMYIHMLMLTQRLCGVMQGKKKKLNDMRSVCFVLGIFSRIALIRAKRIRKTNICFLFKEL